MWLVSVACYLDIGVVYTALHVIICNKCDISKGYFAIVDAHAGADDASTALLFSIFFCSLNFIGLTYVIANLET